MKAHNQTAESRPGAPARQNGAPCVEGSPGCYRELTPHEFHAHKDMAVVVLKDDGAREAFLGYQAVYCLPCSSAIDDLLADWPRERALGLVCPDGECSSRLAIRLSRQGYEVYHLAGGLREWHRCTLG